MSSQTFTLVLRLVIGCVYMMAFVSCSDPSYPTVRFSEELAPSFSFNGPLAEKAQVRFELSELGIEKYEVVAMGEQIIAVEVDKKKKRAEVVATRRVKVVGLGNGPVYVEGKRNFSK